MKTIKQIMAESKQSGRFARAKKAPKLSKAEELKIATTDSEIFFKYKFKEWLFHSTVHAAAQEFERRPDMLEDDWKAFHRRVYDKLEKMKSINGDFVFFSKKDQQAYVAAVDFQKKEVRIITVLPKGKSRPKKGTIRMIIEGVEHELQTIEIE